MADYILVTHNHQTDEETYDAFSGGLKGVKERAVALATEVAEGGKGRTFSMIPSEYVISGRRELSVLQHGRAIVTYRVNDNQRHCDTCLCPRRAFA